MDDSLNPQTEQQKQNQPEELPLWLQKGHYIKTDVDFRTIKLTQKFWFILPTVVYFPLLAWIILNKNKHFYREYKGVAYALDTNSSLHKVLVFIAIAGTICYSLALILPFFLPR